LSQQNFIVLVPAALPPELREFLQEYLHEVGGSHFLFSRSYQQEGAFLALEVVPKDTEERTWRIRLPLQLALAIAQLEEGQARSMGFLT
jgi:hypothetical protein